MNGSCMDTADERYCWVTATNDGSSYRCFRNGKFVHIKILSPITDPVYERQQERFQEEVLNGEVLTDSFPNIDTPKFPSFDRDSKNDRGEPLTVEEWKQLYLKALVETFDRNSAALKEINSRIQ